MGQAHIELTPWSRATGGGLQGATPSHLSQWKTRSIIGASGITIMNYTNVWQGQTGHSVDIL